MSFNQTASQACNANFSALKGPCEPPLSGVRVPVDDVPFEQPRFKMLAGKEHALKLHPTAAGCSHLDTDFVQVQVDTSNALLIAAVLAFAGHHALEITPDAMFNTIMAGVSAHVNADPERFRASFVAHEGKKTLEVQDDTLEMGSWANRWDRPVAELGQLVMDNLSNEAARQVLRTGFTTTGSAQRAAHTMTFMDVVKHYFHYRMVTGCGIPHIDITGCQGDWRRLADVIGPLLTDLGLAAWNKQLQHILGRFVAAFGGVVDKPFWQSMVKYDGRSGSGAEAHVTGWLAQLFPYLDGKVSPAVTIRGGKRAEPYTGPPGGRYGQIMISMPGYHCIRLKSFPGSTTSTPFSWKYYHETHPMQLVGGIIGVTVSRAGSLRPEVGWIVAHEPPEGETLVNRSRLLFSVGMT